MQYMISFRETATDFARRSDAAEAPAYWAAWNAYIGAMGAAGIVVSGAGLAPPDTATTVRLRDGARQVHDGPFADTHEHLGGFFVIEVAGLDEAIEWAARSPCAGTGSTEVRPVLTPPGP